MDWVLAGRTTQDLRQNCSPVEKTLVFWWQLRKATPLQSVISETNFSGKPCIWPGPKLSLPVVLQPWLYVDVDGVTIVTFKLFSNLM